MGSVHVCVSVLTVMENPGDVTPAAIRTCDGFDFDVVETRVLSIVVVKYVSGNYIIHFLTRL